ncbi:MAG: acetylglutamate kinase [Thermoplasmata archaeon]|jgi:acetylglutamate kinase|nr:acetylglutamate kinase [Thermoplasmata archaeon]
MAQVVLKLGGAVVLDAEQVRMVARDIDALLDEGHTLVLVHGGGPQLDKALAAAGEPASKIDGLRVTSKSAAGIVQTVMDSIGADLADLLEDEGIQAEHVNSGEERLAAVAKKIPNGDLGRVGTVQKFSARDLPDGIPVITPVGFDGKGPLNVNADEGACAVAAALKADWLVLGTDVSAVRDHLGASIEELTPAKARELIASSAATGGMIPKLTSAIAALDAGVGRVLITRLQPGTLAGAILDGKCEGTLLRGDAA